MIDCETTILRGHHDGRRLPWVVAWELKLAHKVATFVWLVGQVKDHKMPDEHVVLFWGSYEVVLNLPIFTILNLILELLGKSFELFLQSHGASLRHYFVWIK